MKLVQTPVDAPAASRQSCRDLLSPLPEAGGLTEEEATNKWGNDRTAVLICDGRRAGAVEAIDAANAVAGDHENARGSQ